MTLKMTVREALESSPIVIREKVIFAFKNVFKEIVHENRNLLAGALMWRIKNCGTAENGFTSADRFKFQRISRTPRFGGMFKAYRDMGFTPEEMDVIDTRNLNMRMLTRLAVALKDKTLLFHHITTTERKDLNKIINQYANQVQRFRWGPFWVSASDIAFLDGMIRLIQRNHGGLTQQESYLIPFILYKAIVEFKPTRRLKGLEKLLGDFNLPPRIAQEIFPTLSWRDDEPTKEEEELERKVEFNL